MYISLGKRNTAGKTNTPFEISGGKTEMEMEKTLAGIEIEEKEKMLDAR